MEWKDIALELAQLVQNASQHLWMIGVRESISVGIQSLIGSAICMVLFIFFYRGLRTYWKRYNDDALYSDLDGLILCFAVAFSVISFVASIAFLFQGIANLANPEYYAVRHLLRLVEYAK